MKRVMVGVNFGMLALIFVFLSALGGRDVSGATFCVTNSTELQDALTAAQNNGQDDTIQVVQGTYAGNFTYTASLTENFKLTLQGGFTAGCASRVVDPSNTILDGQNAGRVLTFNADLGNIGARIAIDGFTIKKGQLGADGGGIYANLPGSISITNNAINNNQLSPSGSGGSGGGIYAKTSIMGTITINNNTISGNSSNWAGGGVYATSNGTITINNNTISGNSANAGGGSGGDAGAGGGVYAKSSGIITITNNTISGNSAGGLFGGQGGGGVYATSNGTISITNNTISGNSAGGQGGGVNAAGNGTVTITDNTISGNSTGGYGGGGGVLASGNGTTIIANNTISGNSAPAAAGVYAAGDGTITITSNTISGNSTFGGILVVGDGGGILAVGNGTTTIANNTISGNSARVSGGGVFSHGTAAFYNNIIAGNVANTSGGGVYAQSANQSSVITFTNNTVAMNVAVNNDGGGLYIGLSHDNASARVYNNIIYDNWAGGQWGLDIFNKSDADNNGTESHVDICYNDFTTLSGALPLDTGSGCSAVPNSGNISADPLFVGPGGGNFHLQGISPCIDAGYNSAPGIPSNDKDGNARIQDGVVDMGAYEYGGEVIPTTTTTTTTTIPTTTTTVPSTTTTTRAPTTTTTTTSTTTTRAPTTTTSTTTSSTTTTICLCPPDNTPPAGCISGVVKNLLGQPLAGKTVKLKRTSRPRGAWKTTTNNDGWYGFTDREDGTYIVTVVKCRGGGTKSVTINTGSKVNDVNFRCK